MIHLTEYRWDRVSLDNADLAYLLELVKGVGATDEARVIENLTPTRQAGEYMIRPGPYVGRLGLPSGRAIDIASRFPFDDVVTLITRSGRLPIRQDRLVAPAETGRFLIDVLAMALAREVDRLVAFGLAKGYRRRRFERPPFPGRPDIARHLSRWAGRPDKLSTSATRITHDIDMNRALALALDVLHRVTLGARAAHAIARLRGAFGRVGRTPMAPDAVARIPLDRLTIRYTEALGLAELVLRSQALAPRSESRSGASVLFNMPKAWEAYVARQVADEWGPAFRVEAPHTFDLSNDGKLRSEADVTVWDGDRLVALYDAKYKWLGSTPSMGDVYQMVAYCERLGIEEAILVYPAPLHQRRFEIGDVTVRMMGLEIDAAQSMLRGESDASENLVPLR